MGHSYSAGCRCSDCREDNRGNVAAFRRVNRGKAPREHGRNGYDNYGCRCVTCTEANRSR